MSRFTREIGVIGAWGTRTNPLPRFLGPGTANRAALVTAVTGRIKKALEEGGKSNARFDRCKIEIVSNPIRVSFPPLFRPRSTCVPASFFSTPPPFLFLSPTNLPKRLKQRLLKIIKSVSRRHCLEKNRA